MVKRCLTPFIFIFLSLLILVDNSLAQTTPAGSISGTVLTADGKPAEFVNILLKGTTKGATVDKDGHYTLNNVHAGSYELVASFTGLTTRTRRVEIRTGENIQVDFELAEDNRQLAEVIITAGRNNKKESDYVAKMPLKNVENPQVYSVVSGALLKEQLNLNISQALSNVPGAVPTSDPAGGVSITLRGFTAGIGARNGVQFAAAGRSSVDPVNIERIEVLKGPSATLFGNVISSYGGAINLVTKKPFDLSRTELSYSVGSWGLSRFTADVNTPLNKDKTVLFRVNAAVNKQQSFLQTGHTNTYTFAPSLSYQVNDRLTLSVDIEAYREDLTRVPYLQFGALNLSDVSKVPLDYKQTLYGDGINAVTNTFRTYFEARYKISDRWSSTTNISVNNEKVDKSYQAYPTFLDPTHIERGISLFGPITTYNTDIQHNLKGDFMTGPLRHRFIWGLDYIHSQSDFTYAGGTIDTIDITQPINPASRPQADKAIESGFTALYPSQTEQYATYASDLVNITDRLMTLVSLRVDRYELKGNGGYGQTSFTPKFGLIYQPVKDQVALFGNYMSGFTNNGPVVQPDGTRLVLKPEYAYQWEGGVKVSTADSKLTATASYYSIQVRDAVRYDAGNYAHQDGDQKSSGVELDLTANPIAGLNLTAGYVYNNNKYIKATSGEGKQVTANPRNIANWWASYKFRPGTPLHNLGIGLGGNYAEKSYYDADNTITIPSYVLMNATLFYEQAKWRFGIAVNNLGNKKYWSHSFTANPQPLRQLVANVSFKF